MSNYPVHVNFPGRLVMVGFGGVYVEVEWESEGAGPGLRARLAYLPVRAWIGDEDSWCEEFPTTVATEAALRDLLETQEAAAEIQEAGEALAEEQR